MASLTTFPDLVGYLGSFTIVLLYLLTIQGKVHAAGLFYPLANLLGCGLIMYSLFHNFNSPSFVIEVFWSSVSIYGIVRFLRSRGNAAAKGD